MAFVLQIYSAGRGLNEDKAAAFSGEIEYGQAQDQRQRSADPARARRPVHRSSVGGRCVVPGALGPRPPPLRPRVILYVPPYCLLHLTPWPPLLKERGNDTSKAPLLQERGWGEVSLYCKPASI